MKKFSIFDKKSSLYIFAFFDGLSVAAGALFGFFFPKLLSDVFGANFGTNDLVWFQFVLLPGIAINILYMYFAITLLTFKSGSATCSFQPTIRFSLFFCAILENDVKQKDTYNN